MSTRDDILKIWKQSVPFKRFWSSYITMLTHPKQCFLLLNFAGKIIVKYNITDYDEIKKVIKMQH